MGGIDGVMGEIDVVRVESMEQWVAVHCQVNFFTK